MKAIQSEINKNIQRTNNEEKETGTQINDLERKEEKQYSVRTARREKESKKTRTD